jgi:hypothetical protein
VATKETIKQEYRMKQFEEYKSFTLRDGTKFKARDQYDARLYETKVWHSIPYKRRLIKEMYGG